MSNCSHTDYLSISSWNVNGLGQKHREDMFLESITKHDINILLETWKGDCPDVKIPDYYSFNKCRTKKKKARRNSGGIIVYIKNKIKRGVEYLNNITSSQNRVWLKLEKTFFGLADDIYLCGIYIPPLSSPHYDNEYQNLEYEISILSTKGKIMLMGDFNSRISTYPDFIVDDEDNDKLSHILPDNYKADFNLLRKSQDRVYNSQGKDLLDLCASAQLRILNGRFIGDILGNMTCVNKRGSSVVDYTITSESLLSSVKYFIVENLTHFSDHSQLVTYLNCKFRTCEIQNQYQKQDFSFKWTESSKQILEQELMNPYICEKIMKLENSSFEKSLDGVNLANKMISDIYIDLSTKCMKKKYFKKKRKKFKSPWTDSEFLSLRSSVRTLSNKMKLSPFDQTVRLQFFYLSKKLKRAAKFKRKEYKKNILLKLSNLSPKESKEFWKILKSIKGNDDRCDD